jgi:hypothetical protein
MKNSQAQTKKKRGAKEKGASNIKARRMCPSLKRLTQLGRKVGCSPRSSSFGNLRKNNRPNCKGRERFFATSVYGKVFRSSRRRMNPTAMSKPVPKSNMLPGSGVADTDSVSVEGLLLPRTSETTNRSGWPFKSPVKTTSLSDGPISASELIKMLISGVPDGGEVKAIKSLPGMTGGGLNVTPGHENPTLTPSLNVAGLPKSTEDEPPIV